jgi:hypothetical protein
MEVTVETKFWRSARLGRTGTFLGARTGHKVAHRGDRFILLRERNISRRLLDHTGDDLFQRFGAHPKSSSKRQVLPSGRLLFLSVLVIDVIRSSRAAARAKRPTVHVVVLFLFAGHLLLLVLVPLFWSLAARVVRCSWSACAIRHGELGAGLGKAGEGVHP